MSMNKEDILALSRKENRDGDERQERLKLRSFAISAAVGALLCMILVLLEDVVFDRSAAPIWIIYSGMMFCKYIQDAVKLKDHLDTAVSVICGLWFTVQIVQYILENVG